MLKLLRPVRSYAQKDAYRRWRKDSIDLLICEQVRGQHQAIHMLQKVPDRTWRSFEDSYMWRYRSTLRAWVFREAFTQV